MNCLKTAFLTVKKSYQIAVKEMEEESSVSDEVKESQHTIVHALEDE